MNSILLEENEQLDDLQLNGLRIIQKKDGFKFGTDAVLLSDFAKSIHSDNTLDLCTGSGIIPILMSAKTKTKKFCAIEIQEEIAKTAKRSVELNNLSDRISVICDDLKNSTKFFPKRSFDLITCNPPYMKSGAALLNESDSKIIARHEVKCSLEDIISVSSQLLRQGGHFALVHKPSRLCDIIYLLRKYEIEPKRIRFVQKTYNSCPELVLVDAMYKAKSEVNIMEPLILKNEYGQESEELKRIYHGGKS